MLRFTWWSLRGRWGSIITLCLGLVCISICTTLLAGFTQLSTLTAMHRVSQSWRTPYDLLVRAPDAMSQIESQLHIVDPSMPEQTYGGISLAQLSTIAHIAHVEVAAPEAVIGWVQLHPYIPITLTTIGLFRITTSLYEQENGRMTLITNTQQAYAALPLLDFVQNSGTHSLTHVTYIPLNTSHNALIDASWSLPTLLAGIDPDAESQLVALHWSPQTHIGQSGIPLLMNIHPWTTLHATVTVERAALTLAEVEQISTLQHVTAWTKLAYNQFDSQQILALLAHELGSHNEQNSMTPLQGGGVTRYTRISYTLNDSNNVNSSDATLDVATIGRDISGTVTRFPLLPQSTTPWLALDNGEPGNNGSFTTFDATTLPISQADDTTPMGLYRPEPSGAPTSLLPQNGIASWSPMLFTTLGVACSLTGVRCISVVRVRVAGLGTFGPRSESLLQQVAMDIEARTGLHVDVLTGSSGHPLTTQFLTSNGQSSFAEVWTQPYAAITITSGVNTANILLLIATVSIAMLALIAAALLSIYERVADLHLLLETGWTRRLLLLESAFEATIAALLAALPAWLCSLLLTRLGVPDVPLSSLLSALSIAVLLYILVVTQAAYVMLHDRVRASKPAYQSWTYGPWWWMMFRRQFSWRRSSMTLVIVALAGTCGLVCFMLLVQSAIDGILYATLLGRQVQVGLSDIHIVIALLTCASAVLTTALTLLLVTRERLPELDILRAVGWTQRAIVGEMMREGLLLGLLGGSTGGLVAEVCFVAFYHVWVFPLLPIYLVGAATLGAVLCVMGAIYPVLFSLQVLSKRIMLEE